MKSLMVAGNWKMHKLGTEARELAADLSHRLSEVAGSVSILLCPPFTALPEVLAVIAPTKILLGAQNMHWEEKGAYTGAMTKQIGHFEVANGSTLLLDEIGELPIEWNFLCGHNDSRVIDPKIVHFTRGTPDMGWGDEPFALEWKQALEQTGPIL